MMTRIEKVREDRITFTFEGEEIDVDAGYPIGEYKARLTSLYVRLAPDGQLLSTKASGKKIKKDGTKSMVNAYFPFRDDSWDELALTLLHDEGIHAYGPRADR